VYWADVMYEDVSDASEDNESVVFEGVTAGEVPSIDEGYLETADPGEKAFIEGMIELYNLDADESTPVPDLQDVDESNAYQLEAIPIPWLLKKPMMRILLRDVHHYLFNTEHTPRPGETFKVRDEIRTRFLDTTSAVAARPHVVIAHSMGTVITYDVLKRVAESDDVDAVITIGSPLGLSEIQDQMKPDYTARNGYPSKVTSWANYADRLDPVCGADPKIANDYRRNDEEVIDDEIVKNSGWFRHPAGKYLRQSSLQGAVRSALGF